jgi:hypothetical protein
MYFGDTCDSNQNCVYWGDTSQITIKIMDHNQYHKYNYLINWINVQKLEITLTRKKTKHICSKYKHVFLKGTSQEHNQNHNYIG